MVFFKDKTISGRIDIILSYEVYFSNDSDQMWWERGEEGWFHVKGNTIF
jgi:hypothetical protein